jgi:hypothetical protein
LQQIKSHLLQLKNKDYSEEGLLKWKKLNFQYEGAFLNKKQTYDKSDRHQYTEGLPDGIDFYNTGVLRIIEHYNELDLHKIKANFKGLNTPVELRV